MTMVYVITEGSSVSVQGFLFTWLLKGVVLDEHV